MGNRHRAREIAIMLLYQHDAVGDSIKEVLEGYFFGHPVNGDTKTYVEDFMTGTVENLDSIDALLCQISENWSLERILRVDLSILRLAMFELLYFGTAPAVAIDEAVRLAKRFSSEKASSFINGVLDRAKELSQNGVPVPVTSREQV